jgi:hypothetical protein
MKKEERSIPKVLGIDGEQIRANCELDRRDGRIIRINPPACSIVQLRSRDSVVDRIDGCTVQDAERSSRINDSLVGGPVYLRPVDCSDSRVYFPESLRLIDRCE